jgi:hypothetical protein
MKQRLPALITMLLIAAALVLLTQRERWSELAQGESPAASPEDVVWQLSDAAREGNVRAYLDCFGGALRQKLEKTASDMGEAQFSQYLKQLNGEVTGIAVSDLERTDQQTAALRVEFVFRSRSEAQKHHFKLSAGRWKIDGVDGAERVNGLIPDGASVTDKE